MSASLEKQDGLCKDENTQWLKYEPVILDHQRVIVGLWDLCASRVMVSMYRPWSLIIVIPLPHKLILSEAHLLLCGGQKYLQTVASKLIRGRPVNQSWQGCNEYFETSFTNASRTSFIKADRCRVLEPFVRRANRDYPHIKDLSRFHDQRVVSYHHNGIVSIGSSNVASM